MTAQADVIVRNGKITTMDPRRPAAEAAAVRDGTFLAVGSDGDVMRLAGPATRVIDLRGRTTIPGLHDSHLHVIRGGRMYNMELRWDGVPSLADALRRLKEQVQRTPPPLWVRVVGGWSEFQFAERRLPTLEEVNAISAETPVFILHLYHLALLNRAALKACGINKDSPNPPGGEIQRGRGGEPTGLLIARPDAALLYATLAQGPDLGHEDQVNSTRQFMRELNRFGLTSICDAGGGKQQYPEHYQVFAELARQGQLTIRTAYNLFTQTPGHELQDYEGWVRDVKVGEGDDFFRHNGAGELISYTGYDFEDFPEPRPEPSAATKTQLRPILELLVRNRWPFRLHATYDESITAYLDVIEAIDRDIGLGGLCWFFDHAETISPANIDCVATLQGGIAIQDRLAFQGEYFSERYGTTAAANAPPIADMLQRGIPVGAGTDGTRVSTYNPWVSIHWLHTGKTLGGLVTNGLRNRLSREEALRRYTVGSAWFSGDAEKKGAITEGQLGDLAVLSSDYFTIPEDEIRGLSSVLTMVGGNVVYADAEFKSHAPPALSVSPAWSPVKYYGGYAQGLFEAPDEAISRRVSVPRLSHKHRWAFACGCFA